MTTKERVIVCIPAFNEAKTISRVVAGAKKYADQVLVCDDGSQDATGNLASEMGATVITHSRNQGYGASLRSLFAKATELGASVVVTIDGDGQHDPSDIPRLVEPILSGDADLVIGSRFLGNSEIPSYRQAGVKAITRVVGSLTGVDVSDAQSGFRAYSSRALQAADVTEDGMGVSVELLQKAARSGLRIAEVPVKIDYQVDAPSTHNPAYHAADVIASVIKHYSIRHPLLFYGIPGLVLIAAGFVLGFSVLDIFAATHKLAVGQALLSVGAFIIGTLLSLTGILLFTIITVLRERNP